MNTECSDFVWQHLSLRKHVVGRRLVNRLASAAARRMSQFSSEQDIASSVYAESKNDECKMGLIATLILSALISEIVRLVIQWVKERAAT